MLGSQSSQERELEKMAEQRRQRNAENRRIRKKRRKSENAVREAPAVGAVGNNRSVECRSIINNIYRYLYGMYTELYRHI